MNNKVFYQHPNLMRILGMHETVMEVMVNVLGGDKSQVSQLLLLDLSLLYQFVKRHPHTPQLFLTRNKAFVYFVQFFTKAFPCEVWLKDECVLMMVGL